MNQTHALHQLVPLAAELDENKVTPGLLGFVVFAVIALGLWALMKNMGKQMKKIDFEEEPEVPPAAGRPESEVPHQAAAARAGAAPKSAPKTPGADATAGADPTDGRPPAAGLRGRRGPEPRPVA
ncbi:hypothetical protein GA0115240_13841, partial [Streptomyces sp. DvalAA-14]|uniref:hypothetical protein n=1 Tax=unclassified Streptomyces TaxID=2593676 RepID=UPI00081B2E8D